MTTMDSLLGSLLGVPSLPGAKCRGRSHLFDAAEQYEPAEIVEQRHNQAKRLCAGCSSLETCRTWLESLPLSRKPVGVVAGRVIHPRKPRSRMEAT